MGRKRRKESYSSYSTTYTDLVVPELAELALGVDDTVDDGENLDAPDTAKDTNYGDGNGLEFAVCSMQGWRPTMEDTHVVDLDFEVDGSTASLFAVFDGHGGVEVARICEKELPRRLRKSKAMQRGDVQVALRESIEELDDEIVRGDFDIKSSSGATVLVSIVTNKMIYVAHLGDSRCVIGQRKSGHKTLTEDHIPTHWREKRRIEKAGAYVMDKRVNGSLAMSRAMGDVEFKNNMSRSPSKQAVVATPELAKHARGKADFMVMACDGIWEVLSNKRVIKFVRERLKKNWSLKSIAKDLCDACLAREDDLDDELGRDNMTVIIVAFKNKPTQNSFYASGSTFSRADTSRTRTSNKSKASEDGKSSPTSAETTRSSFFKSPSPPKKATPTKSPPRLLGLGKGTGTGTGGSATTDTGTRGSSWKKFTSIFRSSRKESTTDDSSEDSSEEEEDSATKKLREDKMRVTNGIATLDKIAPVEKKDDKGDKGKKAAAAPKGKKSDKGKKAKAAPKKPGLSLIAVVRASDSDSSDDSRGKTPAKGKDKDSKDTTESKTKTSSVTSVTTTDTTSRLSRTESSAYAFKKEKKSRKGKKQGR